MTKIATYFEALSLEVLLLSKGVHVKGLNLATIIALITALAPVLAAGGPAATEIINGLKASLPILESVGIVPPQFGPVLDSLVAGYANYEAGSPATIGPITVAIFGGNDKVSLVIQKA
jgi:hypothetical protein